MAKKNKKDALRAGFNSYFNSSPAPKKEIAKEPIEEIEEEIIPAAAGNTVGEIALSDISVNPKQPRRDFEEKALNELADSLKTHGLIQPITVRKMPDGKYQLISGERRMRASKIAGLETIPAYIRETDDGEMHVLALIENIQREDLNPIEVAISLTLLKEELHLETDEQIAKQVGKSRAAVTNYKRLLNLPPEIINAVRDRSISFGHAKALAGLKNVDTQLVVFKEQIDKGFSVRELEALVKEYKPKKKKSSTASLQQEHYNILKAQLKSYFSLNANVKAVDGKNGKITLTFSNDDIDRIMDLLE